MSVAEVQSMTGRELVEFVAGKTPSEQAVAWVAALVSEDAVFEAARELRARFKDPSFKDIPRTESGRLVCATSVQIDGERFRTAMWRRRLALRNVGPMMEPPRSGGWAYVMLNRGRINFYALDDLATALGTRADELIQEFGTESELRRMCS